MNTQLTGPPIPDPETQGQALPGLATEIRGSRLVLTPLRVTDAAEMIPVLAEPELYQFTGGEPPSQEELTARYRRQLEVGPQEAGQIWLNWVIRLNGAAIGYAQATVHPEATPNSGAPTNTPRAAALAWVIGKPWQRQGVATEAMRLVSTWLRRRGVPVHTAEIQQGHLASERVAMHLGMQLTGEWTADGERVWRAAPQGNAQEPSTVEG